MEATATSKGIQVTPRAIEQVRALLAQENVPATGGLRLAVQGGGCSGLSYAIRFDTQSRPNDKVFEFDGVKVFVDPKSFIYLAGTVLDYKVDLMQQRFVFENPQASKSCGCGESFTA